MIWLESAESLRELVAAWEAGTLPKADWTHAAHVAVCAVLLVRYPEDALDRMIAGIIRYNEAVGTVNGDNSGYHATLTRFWVEVVAGNLRVGSGEWEAAREAVATYGSARDLHCRFYSFDVVQNSEARRAWIAPDRGLPMIHKRVLC